MIYPINEALERLMESFIDEETGELTVTEEEMNTAIEQLQMDFDDKIVELRNQYINLTAEADAIKAEKMKLADRQKKTEESAERTKRFLAYLLKGEKFKKDACRISYRKSEEVVTDEGFVEWATYNAPELLSVKDPEPRKTDIKNLMHNGVKFDHAYLNTKQNIQIN